MLSVLLFAMLDSGTEGRADLRARWSFDVESPWIVAESVGPYLGLRSPTGTRYDAEGASGKALFFEGSGEGQVRVGDRLPLTEGAFTWVFWARLKSGDNPGLVVFVSRHEPGLPGGYYIAYDGERRVLEAYAGSQVTTALPVIVDDDRWRQVAVTYEPDGDLRVYLDGTGPLAAGAAAKVTPTLAGLTFGNHEDASGTRGFRGGLDDIQVYDRALSPFELRLLREFPGRSWTEVLSEVVRIDPDGGAFTNAIPVTLTTLAAGAEIRYTLDGSEPGIGSPLYREPLRISESITLKARAFGTNGEPRSRVATSVFAIRQERYPAARLLGHWTFDQAGADVAADARGRYPGVLSARGAAMVAGGVAGGALRLDHQQGGHVNMGDVLPLTGTEFTISCWVRGSTDGTRSPGYLVSKIRTGVANGYSFFYNTEWMQFQGRSGAGGAVQASLSGRDDAWHHVAFTCTLEGDARLHLDGGLPVAAGNIGRLMPSDASFMIGSHDGYLPGGTFTGWIDDVQVYGLALREDEIAYLRDHPGQTLAEPAAALAMVPDGGSFFDGVRVRLETSVLDGTIHYTVDGSVPTTNSPTSRGSVFLLEPTELKARVFVRGMPASDVRSRQFQVVPEPVEGRRLLGRWRFDETVERVASDETGWFPGLLMGTSTNGARFVPNGISGNAVRLLSRFEGRVDLGDALQLTNRAFSVSVWFRLDEGSTASDVALLARHQPGHRSGFYIVLNSQNGPVAAFVGGTAHAISRRKVDDAQWHHLVLAYGASQTLRLFIDAEAASDVVPVESPVWTASPTFLGTTGASSTSFQTPRYSGWIDELQAYDFELSEGQVTRLYARPGERLAVEMDPPPRAPTIVEAPKPATVIGGETVTFLVASEGTPPLTYQWFRDGVAIEGATGTRLTLQNARVTSAGAYQVRVTNRMGTVASEEVPLRVTVPPTGDLASLVAHWRFDEGSGSEIREETGWYPSWIVNQTPASVPGGVVGNALRLDRTQGGYVALQRHFALPAGPFTLSLWYRSPSVAPDQEIVLFSHHDPVSATGTYLAYQPSSGICLARGGAQVSVSQIRTNFLDGRWHHVLLSRTPNGDVRLYLDGNAPVGGLDLMTVPPPATRAYLGARPTPTPGREPVGSLEGWIDEVQVYDFAVTDEMAAALFRDPGSRLPVLVRPPPTPPAIVEATREAVLKSGERVTLRVSASGAEPLEYQWYFNEMPIPGATQPVLEIAALSPAQVGNYRVLIRNLVGIVRSDVIPVSLRDQITVAPEFLLAPIGRTVPLGSPVAFSTVVTGSAPLAFQWFHNGLPIFGANQASYSIAKVDSVRLAGNYHVEVTNDAGHIRSPEVPLDIEGTPDIRLSGPEAVREGGLAYVDLHVVTGGSIQSVRFFFRYPAAVAKLHRIRWSEFVDAERSRVSPSPETSSDILNIWIVARDPAGFPSGDQRIATFEFSALPVPARERARLEFLPWDPVYFPDPVEGWVIFPTDFDIHPRRVKGDENGNLHLDVGDLASHLDRFRRPASFTPGLIAANDLDASGTFDLADAARALRIIVRRDGPPDVGPALPGEAEPQPPAAKDILASLLLDPAASPATQVRATLRLAAKARPLRGASFTLRYDPSVFRIRTASDVLIGAVVPSDALSGWHQPTNEPGVLHFAAASAADWTTPSDLLATVDFDVLPEVATGTTAKVQLENLEIARGPDVGPEPSLPITAVFNAQPERAPVLVVARSGESSTWTFRVEGSPGGRYAIEMSSDLVRWQVLPAVVAAADGIAIFRHGPETSDPRGFYRARAIRESRQGTASPTDSPP